MESDLKDLELFDIYWKDYNEVESIILSLNSMIQFDDAEQLSEKIRFMLPKFEEVGSIPNENDLRLSIRNYLFKNGDDDLSSKVFQKEITLFTVEIKKLLKMIKRCFEDISDKLKTDDLVLEKYNNNGKINLFYVCKDDPNVNSISDNFDYYVELWGRLFMKHTTVCTYLASFFIGSWSFYNLLLEVCEPYLFDTSNPKGISNVSELKVTKGKQKDSTLHVYRQKFNIIRSKFEIEWMKKNIIKSEKAFEKLYLEERKDYSKSNGISLTQLNRELKKIDAETTLKEEMQKRYGQFV